MKTREAYPPEIISAAAFLKRREPWLKECPREMLLRFMQWYASDGRLGIVRKAGRVVAVALARTTNDIERARMLAYHNDEKGRIIWIDHIASAVPEGIPVLLLQACQRFGPREAFAGEVFKRDGELRMLPFRLVERLSQLGDTHGLTLNSRTTRAA